MPKNKKGGKKFKRGKKNVEDSNMPSTTRFAEEGQVYAQIKKRMGGSRLEVECSDSKVRSAIIPGRFKKRVWMNPGDVILVSIEDTSEDNLCYIEHKYKPGDISVLKIKGLITFEEEEDAYEFGDDMDMQIIDQQNIPEFPKDDDLDIDDI